NKYERKIIRFSLVLLFIQIALGGWTSTNYAALACTDYPTCHGSLVPEMDFYNAFTIFRELGVTSIGEPLSLEALHAIQWVHRIGAIVLLVYLLFVAYILKVNQGFNMWRNVLILVISLQFIIGIANLLLHLPIVLATLHNLGAALLVVILVGINSRITKPWQN
ncbi:MAG: COX15/CtaA family protein, partial [Methylophilaceae bacterium]|nr:COX15/CtaA family protein [Methylophilaceae bacterium]